MEPEPRSGDASILPSDHKYLSRRSAAPDKLMTTLTQGSQSLALGLVLAAASQLVERRQRNRASRSGLRLIRLRIIGSTRMPAEPQKWSARELHQTIVITIKGRG